MNIIYSYFEFWWKLTVYTVGSFMLWAAEGVSLLIPPLKDIIRDYERICSLRSMFFIMLASISAITTLFILFDVSLIYFGYDPAGDIVFYLMGYVVWIPMGIALLSSLHDYKYKKKGL